MSRLKFDCCRMIDMHNKQKNASLTVEAGLVFPVFLFAVLALCCFFRYINAEFAVEKSMLATARNMGAYPEIIKAASEKENSVTEALIGGLAGKKLAFTDVTVGNLAENLADGIIIEGLLTKELNKHIFASDIIEDISCFGSVVFSEDDTILIKCSYMLKTPVSMFGLGRIPVKQELEYRYFTGTQVDSLLTEEDENEGSEDDRIVYITEEKIVYHQSLSCPALNLVIRTCKYSEVGNQRNLGGGKYYPCERCKRKKKAPETVYISKEGDRYHYKRDCSGLKRTITEIKLSEAEKTRRACLRCKPKN